MRQIKLGDVELKSNVILAPMAGITDLPFRKIVREFGDFLVFSEMIASQAVIRNVRRTHKMLEGADDPFCAVQIVGADPFVMADAAKLSFDLGARFLDINMGCPVKKIVKSDAGSALMKNEGLARDIIESVVRAVPIPVSLKMRLGWDMGSKNAPNIAKIAEEAGVSMITVHGRTRSQLYSGTADWAEIMRVREAIRSIPLIVNGDIKDVFSAREALSQSGADGVMIGRGALGRPWILQDIHNHLNNIDIKNEITNKQKFNIATKQIQYMQDFYDGDTAIKMARRVLMYYCKGVANAAAYRQSIASVNSREDIDVILSGMFEVCL